MPEYINLDKAAEIASCSIYHIREAIKRGDLEAYRPARAYLVKPEDLDKWIKKSRVKKPVKAT